MGLYTISGQLSTTLSYNCQLAGKTHRYKTKRIFQCHVCMSSAKVGHFRTGHFGIVTRAKKLTEALVVVFSALDC